MPLLDGMVISTHYHLITNMSTKIIINNILPSIYLQIGHLSMEWFNNKGTTVFKSVFCSVVAFSKIFCPSKTYSCQLHCHHQKERRCLSCDPHHQLWSHVPQAGLVQIAFLLEFCWAWLALYFLGH